MKFLIIARVRQPPVEIWARLLPAHFKYLDKLEKERTVEVSYHLIGQQGDALIVNANSDDDLARIIGEDPLFFYTEREIYPLTTREAHKQRLEKILGITRPRARRWTQRSRVIRMFLRKKFRNGVKNGFMIDTILD